MQLAIQNFLTAASERCNLCRTDHFSPDSYFLLIERISDPKSCLVLLQRIIKTVYTASFQKFKHKYSLFKTIIYLVVSE